MALFGDNEDKISVYDDPSVVFFGLVDQQVDGITANVYLENSPLSPVKTGQGIMIRGNVWLVVVVREWTDEGSQLTVSKCNETGVLYRRREVMTAHGPAYEIIEKVPFIGVWRIMSATENPDLLKEIAKLMPVGSWSWRGGPKDIIVLDKDGSQWEQHAEVMSDRTALSMVLSEVAVVQLRKVPAVDYA